MYGNYFDPGIVFIQKPFGTYGNQGHKSDHNDIIEEDIIHQEIIP